MGKDKPCGNPNCGISTGIHGGLTFGSGELDSNGFWEKPCSICARAWDKKYPDEYEEETWPFKKQGE